VSTGAGHLACTAQRFLQPFPPFPGINSEEVLQQTEDLNEPGPLRGLQSARAVTMLRTSQGGEDRCVAEQASCNVIHGLGIHPR
jgi:hypothetical protein